MKRRILLSLALLVVTALTLWGASTKFYDDDPILREPETRDASGAKEWKIDLTWDLAYNLFAHPGDATANVRAQNINTIDEVPDSNWFTNRILSRPVSIEEAVNGPIVSDGPAPPPWTIIRPKEAGAAPGFTMRDSNGTDWFVSFDAKDQPEAATSSIIVANKIFWTLGYWQVENHLINIRPGDLKIGESATMKLANGKRRPMRKSDLDDVLRRSENTSGAYRAVAGKGLKGTILGGFKYVGTRPDDPNDIVPHEHRRELRAMKVFGAWTNLVDMKAGNTLDAIVQEGGKGVVRHYLQDVGSTFGTGALLPREYDEGWEYLFEGSLVKKRLITFGFYPLRPWQTVDYKEYPSIGRFEAEAFNPTEWKPRVPTAAFTHALPDDNFWAARRVMAFSDDMIRAIVKTGRFSDAEAEKHLADTLIARRDKIGKAYLAAVNPLVGFALDGSGALTFVNAATAAGVSDLPAGGYSASWAIFDNLSGLSVPFGVPTAAERERIQAPPGLPQAAGTFIRVRVAAVRPANVAWSDPVTVYFRRLAGGWKLVGLER